jgi:hypothetical protein
VKQAWIARSNRMTRAALGEGGRARSAHPYVPSACLGPARRQRQGGRRACRPRGAARGRGWRQNRWIGAAARDRMPLPGAGDVSGEDPLERLHRGRGQARHKHVQPSTSGRDNAEAELKASPSFAALREVLARRLNQVEIWFAKIERDVIARGVFTSTSHLSKKLMRCIRRYNRNAHPIRWSYNDPRKRIAASDSSLTNH